MIYRHRIRIVLDILDAIKDGHSDGVLITHVMRKANIPYNRIVRIVGELVRVGLIEEITEKRKYRITPSGIRFLSEWEKFSAFAESFGLEL
ncbi:MAG: winged helix-turn-helix domain-containing protein [Candidatus Bathyarchaeia archaeon]